MGKQIINNQTGTADTLKVMADKCINNFNELYSAIVTNTSDLTNHGSDGIHPFISSGDTIAMSSISGLTTSLTSLQDSIDRTDGNLTTLESTVDTNANDIVTINNTLMSMNSIINEQNAQIATLIGQIEDLYTIINNL